MEFLYSAKVKELQTKLTNFMEEHVYPNEKVYEQQLNELENRWSAVPQVMEDLRISKGCFSELVSESEYGAGLTNLEYAPL
jgi:acyl-CoA dehydrogenase